MSRPQPRNVLSRDALALAGLLIATAWVRVWTLRTIDLGGDATYKWYLVRSWSYANPWVFDHHSARFAINVPIWITQQLFGTHPNGMFVTPLLASVAQVPLLYGCGRALGSRASGVLACLGLLWFEPMVDASSQLLPGIFQATYVLAALYCVLRFARAPEADRHFLLLAGLGLFLAYLAMVTSVYVLPGLLLAVWLIRRRVRDVLSLSGTFAALLACETLGYALSSSYRFGQLQLILHTHTDVKPTGFWGLFGRYSALPLDWRAVLAAWSSAFAVWLVTRLARGAHARQPGAVALWLAPASLLAGMTFGVKSLDPIIPATDFSIRYCDVLMPLIALCLAAALCWIARRLLAGRRSPAAVLPLTAAAALALTTWGASALYRPATEHAFEVTDRQWRMLNAALDNGIPIVGSNRGDHFQMKTLTCIQWGYLQERHLLKDGALSPIKLGKARLRDDTHRYLSRPDPGADHVARALRTRSCVVTAQRRSAEPKLALDFQPGPGCSLP